MNRRTFARAGGGRLLAGLAVVLGSAALAGPAMAQDAVPAPAPQDGRAITVFPSRNMVEAAGFRDGESVTVAVFRGASDVPIGTATGIADGDDPRTAVLEGAVEVNHPGGACWTGAKPDIQAGDRVVTTAGAGAAEQTTVAHVSADDWARYAPSRANPDRDASGRYLIRLEGTAVQPDGSLYPVDRLEARLINPVRFSAAAGGRRDLRADTATGNFTYRENGHWTAEWRLSPADAAKAVQAEPRVLWLGADPLAGNELTIHEFGVGDEGCGADGAAVDPAPLGATPPATLPPAGGRSIEVFPSRDFVAAAGVRADELADVEVLRYADGAAAPQVVGVARDVAPNEDGDVEVNHPGGACWDTSAESGTAFPDIRPHDVVRVTAHSGAAGRVVSQTTVADVVIPADTEVDDAADEIVVTGTALTPDGRPWPASANDQLEVRLRNTELLPLVGRQELRASTGSGTARFEGTFSIDNATGVFRAVFAGKGAAVRDVARDAATEQRILWLGADPLAGAEATLFERGSAITGGPGCTVVPAGTPAQDAPLSGAPTTTAPPGATPPPAPGGGTPPAGGTAPGGTAPGGTVPGGVATGGTATTGGGTGASVPAGAILVPGLGGALTTITGPDGKAVLRGQVDAASLAKLARGGVLSVVLEQKARANGVLYRFKIRRVAGKARTAAVAAAAAKRSPSRAIATFWRSAPKTAGRHRFNLKSRALRGLKPGRYVVEVTPTDARRKAVGPTLGIAFRIR